MYINLQIHEGLPLEIASEAEVQFDIVGGINITLSQHLVVHIVKEQAIQFVTNDLQSVPGHSSKIGTYLVRVRFQDRVQLLLGQAELSRCVNKNQAIEAVPDLLHLRVLSVNDVARRSECLADSEARVEESFRTNISGFGGNQAYQVQLAHEDHTVDINPEALAVIPCRRSIMLASRSRRRRRRIVSRFSFTDSPGYRTTTRSCLFPNKKRTAI